MNDKRIHVAPGTRYEDDAGRVLRYWGKTTKRTHKTSSLFFVLFDRIDDCVELTLEDFLKLKRI